jgi:hypothetical protein
MGNRSLLTRMAILFALCAPAAGCAGLMDKPDSAPLYSYTRANPESAMTPVKGDGYELALPPGWQAMEGVSAMKKGEQFRFPLDWLGIDLGGRVQDASGYSQFGFEFGNLRAVYRKPGKGGVLVLFSSWGGTRESLPAGIKRYLDATVPDNTLDTVVSRRIKPDKLYPLITTYKCRAVKEGKPVTFGAVTGWTWSFSRMYTFAAFYPAGETPAEILDMAASLK